MKGTPARSAAFDESETENEKKATAVASDVVHVEDGETQRGDLVEAVDGQRVAECSAPKSAAV